MLQTRFLDHSLPRACASRILDLGFAARLADDWNVPIDFEVIVDERCIGCDRVTFRLQTSAVSRSFQSTASDVRIRLAHDDLTYPNTVRFAWRPRTSCERFIRVWTVIDGEPVAGRITVGRVCRGQPLEEVA